MTTAPDGIGRRVNPWITAGIISTLFSALVLWFVFAVTGYFRLSSETAALRTAFMQALPGSSWHKQVVLRVGWFTTCAVRFGTSFFSIPPEPRAAVAALRGGEVGVYRLETPWVQLKAAPVLQAMDRAMKSEGWDRIVAVAESRQFVAVYWPHKGDSPRGVKCCVLVFDGDRLIVTSGRANLTPLFNLARSRIDWEELRKQVPTGI